MENCVFCKIVSGAAEASIVFRDDICTAFLTIEPITQGHTLIIPNRHYRDILELPADTAGHMFQVAKRLAESFQRTDLKSEGVNVVMCNGAAAAQTVFHAHIHVNPRYTGDGFSWNMPPGFEIKPDRVELNAVADKLRHAIGR